MFVFHTPAENTGCQGVKRFESQPILDSNEADLVQKVHNFENVFKSVLRI